MFYYSCRNVWPTVGFLRSDIFVISKVEGGLTAAETRARLAIDRATLDIGTIDAVLLHYPKAAPGSSLNATIAWQVIGSLAQKTLFDRFD